MYDESSVTGAGNAGVPPACKRNACAPRVAVSPSNVRTSLSVTAKQDEPTHSDRRCRGWPGRLGCLPGHSLHVLRLGRRATPAAASTRRRSPGARCRTRSGPTTTRTGTPRLPSRPGGDPRHPAWRAPGSATGRVAGMARQPRRQHRVGGEHHAHRRRARHRRPHAHPRRRSDRVEQRDPSRQSRIHDLHAHAGASRRDHRSGPSDLRANIIRPGDRVDVILVSKSGEVPPLRDSGQRR